MEKATASPPKIFLRFFRWYCHPKLVKHIEGDLMELYDERLKTKGKRSADLQFIVDVLLLFRLGIIKSQNSHNTLDTYGMYKSYLTIGWRNLLRNKGYSFINIGGLAVGMTVALLIGLWVLDELSFNKYHKNYESIAQVWEGGTNPESGLIEGGEALQFPLAAAIKANYGHQFKHVLLAWWVGSYMLSDVDSKLTKTGEFIQSGAPEMLSLKMLKGTYSALEDPHSIILSASTAKAIFGDEDPMNKSLKIDNRIDVKVTGVYEDLPANNRFAEVQFFSPWELWVSSNDWIKRSENEWRNWSFNIYVQVADNTTVEKANEAIKKFFQENGPKEIAEDIKKNKTFIQLYPMSKWHLYSEFVNGRPIAGRITFVWLFSIVGIFVLLLACINFVNLSTARSEKRAKEVGIRKSIGSDKGQLIFQFLSESFLVVSLAFGFSLILSQLSLNWFNEVAAKQIVLPLTQPLFWVTTIGFIVLTGVLAGIYPAFYLSSFQPVRVLKGMIRLGHFSSLPRKVMVVVQFTVSVVLMIGTVIVYQQIEFARSRPVGYDRQGLISIPMNDPGYSGKHEVIKSELYNTGVVSDMALSYSPLTMVWNNSGGFIWQGRDMEKDNDFAICNGTHDFGRTVGWKFVEGRDFSPDFPSDTAAVILNETAVKYMGLKSPVGQIIRTEISTQVWKVIGVVQDMIMQSPYEPVKQTLFFLDANNGSYLHIRIKHSVSAAEALPKIEAVIKTLVPSALFDYKFVDQEYDLKFASEGRIGTLSGFFAVLAIFISGLGLFGLASFVAEQRTKEIGIRKVIGASIFSLWRMLSKDFVILVLISCAVSIPVAYYYMNGWLQKYQYHTEIGWSVFVMAIGAAVLITLLTVSFQAIKAAMASPVKSLRSE